MCMIKEVWRDIPNYEGLYQISNYGRAKSVERVVKCKKEGMFQKYQSYILKPDKSTNYPIRITVRLIHHLMLYEPELKALNANPVLTTKSS